MENNIKCPNFLVQNRPVNIYKFCECLPTQAARSQSVHLSDAGLPLQEPSTSDCRLIPWADDPQDQVSTALKALLNSVSTLKPMYSFGKYFK